jgi:hypothetical protein
MKELFFKHASRELSEQTFARLRFTENVDSFQGTEMLIAGYIMNTGMQYGIYDLKFDEQTFLSESEYKRHWSAIQSWLKEIDETEFYSCYHRACDFLLQSDKGIIHRTTKNIYKLDRNFHVYVHGDKAQLQEGTDDKGKFLKLYYINSL